MVSTSVMRTTSLLLWMACGGAIAGCGAPQPPTVRNTGAGADDAAKPSDVIALLARTGFPDPSSPLAYASELAMFEDQLAPLRALAERLRGRVAELEAGRDAAQAALEGELEKSDRDAAQIRALATEVARIDAESTLIQLEARLETRRILRPDQLVKLRALRSATSL